MGLRRMGVERRVLMRRWCGGEDASQWWMGRDASQVGMGLPLAPKAGAGLAW